MREAIEGKRPARVISTVEELNELQGPATRIVETRRRPVVRSNDLADWQYQVANGDTVLGFAEWQKSKAESERPRNDFTIAQLSNRRKLRL